MFLVNYTQRKAASLNPKDHLWIKRKCSTMENEKKKKKKIAFPTSFFLHRCTQETYLLVICVCAYLYCKTTWKQMWWNIRGFSPPYVCRHDDCCTFSLSDPARYHWWSHTHTRAHSLDMHLCSVPFSAWTKWRQVCGTSQLCSLEFLGKCLAEPNKARATGG